MTQLVPNGPAFRNGIFVKLSLRRSDGSWKQSHFKNPQIAAQDGKRGMVVDSVYLGDRQCLYNIRISDDIELNGIPEDCLISL